MTSVPLVALGIHQHIDAAALELFLTYKFFEAELRSTTGVISNFDDFQTVIAGTRIRF